MEVYEVFAWVAWVVIGGALVWAAVGGVRWIRGLPPEPDPPYDPGERWWRRPAGSFFRHHWLWVLAAAVALFGGVYALDVSESRSVGSALLYVAPIFLLAVLLGRVGGIAAAAVALALTASGAEVNDAYVSSGGYAAFAVLFLLVGSLDGHFRQRPLGGRKGLLMWTLFWAPLFIGAIVNVLASPFAQSSPSSGPSHDQYQSQMVMMLKAEQVSTDDAVVSALTDGPHDTVLAPHLIDVDEADQQHYAEILARVRHHVRDIRAKQPDVAAKADELADGVRQRRVQGRVVLDRLDATDDLSVAIGKLVEATEPAREIVEELGKRDELPFDREKKRKRRNDESIS